MALNMLANLAYKELTTKNGAVVGLYRIASDRECIDIVRLESGKNYGPHHHLNVDEQVTIIRGHGTLVHNGHKTDYYPGLSFLFLRGTSHEFQTQSPTYILSEQSSPIVDFISGINDIVND